MATLTKSDPRIEEFCSLIQAGIDAWKRAGKILCKLLDDDATIFAKILEQRPYLTRETLESFERIGRRELYPYLAVDNSPGARRLAALPYSEQERIYQTRVAVVVKVKGGFTEQKFKRVHELNEHEAARVFNGDRLRTVQEQLHLVTQRKRSVVRATRAATMSDESEPESTAGTASLEASPIDELKRLLTLGNDALLEARSVLASVQRGSRKDAHITTALREIGALRFAVNEGDLA
jgi:hypothetical protein